MLEEAGQIKNTVVLIFRHIECLHVMNFPMDWEWVSSKNQVLRGILLDPGYLPDYLSVLMTMLWRTPTPTTIFFAQFLHTFPCLQKSIRDFFHYYFV